MLATTKEVKLDGIRCRRIWVGRWRILPTSMEIQQRLQLKNLSQVSGINISRDKRLVFASETGAKRIAVFKRNPENGELKFVERIKLNGSPDNINVSEDGSLVVANIPKILALIQHFVALQKGEIKPPLHRWLESIIRVLVIVTLMNYS